MIKPFAILSEKGNEVYIEELLQSTASESGVDVPRFFYKMSNLHNRYYFWWSGRRFGAGFEKEVPESIPKYQLKDFKYICQLEEVLK